MPVCTLCYRSDCVLNALRVLGGTQLVFATQRSNGNSEIYVINADGTGPQRSTNNTAQDSYPAWQPLTGVPTAVTLASFNATGYESGTLLEWQTGL